MIPLQHRAAQASAAIDAAKTSLQKHDARQVALGVVADLKKHIADDKAMAAFKGAVPQNSIGMWKETVRDAPLFLVGPGGKRITTTIALPDGSKATPNPEGQIVVPAHLVPAMIARGFKRANDVLTDQHSGMRDPARPNNT
jgi:hypothetical protein